MKIRKELWFGFTLMAIILTTVAIFTPWAGFFDGHLNRDDLGALGLLMLGLIVAKVKIPTLIHTGHGLFGLAALAVLFTANLQGPATAPHAWWAFVVFGSGMIGGLLLFRVLFAGKPTVPLALVHGSVAAVGLYLLFGVTGF